MCANEPHRDLAWSLYNMMSTVPNPQTKSADESRLNAEAASPFCYITPQQFRNLKIKLIE
jgi:hypothetical protein